MLLRRNGCNRSNARCPGKLSTLKAFETDFMAADTTPSAQATVADVMHALAYVGDLSMGQPTDHSLRTAWLGARIAEVAGCSGPECASVLQVALLRWSGCTANAHELSGLIADDVAGRALMLAQSEDDPAFAVMGARLQGALQALTQIHCEVSGDIARMMGVPADVEQALRSISATVDGSGPNDHPQLPVPTSVYVVELASNLEIFGRVHGLERALEMIRKNSGKTYPRTLADLVVPHAAAWLAALDDEHHYRAAVTFGTGTVQLELMADVIDLKLPWMTGHSRRVAEAALRAAARLGMSRVSQLRCYRAGLLHGIGRAAVPNRVWNTQGKLSAEAREKIRLAPYWTCRAATRIGALAADAELGSYVGERLDGSGTFRACGRQAIPIEGQVVAVAAAWVALQSPRPWRAAMSEHEGRAVLDADVVAGRFDAAVVDALTCSIGPQAVSTSAQEKLLLTERETDVLRCISLGQTTKEVARALGISPSTVRTHVENVFHKLNCTTRAAATLKASTLRLL